MPASSDRNNNNSAEEEQQQHSSVASRYRSDEGAIFSSSKCPPAPGPQNGCGLPFGFLWTPLAPPTTTPTTHPTTTTGGLKSDSDGIPDDAIEGLPAGVICITCLAYLNLYCDVDRHTGRWKCALCQSDNVLTQEPTDGGALPLTLQGSDDWLSRREVFFQQPLRERIFLANSSSSPSSSHSRAAWNMTHRIVLVVDQNLPASEVHAIGAAMQQQQQQQYRNNNNTADWTTIEMEWGLIVFGKTVQLYHLGADALAAADVIQRSSLFPSPNDLAATQQQHHSPDTYRRDYATSATEHSTDHSVYLGRSVDTLLTCLTACFGLVRTGNTTSSSSGTGNSFDPSHASLQLASAAEEADPRPKSRLEILKERKQARLQNQEDASATASSLLLSPNSKVSPSSNTNAIPSQSPWVLARKRAAASAPPHRCTGRAIQIAIDLMSIESPQSTESFAIAGPAATISSSRSSGAPRQNRILLFTNGCPNLGDGSVVDMQQNKNNNTASSSGNAAYSTVDTEKLARASEFFDLITKEASESNIGIDVFGTGVSELGLPVYQSLTEPSSGYVLLHDTFTSLHLLRNLQFVLQQTHLISAQYFPETNRNSESSPQEQLAIQSPFQEGTWLDACSVDIRMSSFLEPSHLIGPGDLSENTLGPLVNEQACFEQGVKLAEETLKLPKNKVVPSIEMLDASLTRIRLGRCDPLSTFSVMINLNDFFQHDEHAFFQCIVRYIDRQGLYLVTRVTTHRLSVAKSVGEFLEAVDEEVIPVLLGKEAVYRAMFGIETDVDHPFQAPHAGQLDNLAFDAQRDLDHTVFRISGEFRLLSLEKGTRSIDLTEEGGIKAAGSSMDFAFPPELSDALRRLYHLRRGPFLSPGPLLSLDDRAEMRSLFVRFPLEDCLTMMAPSLWSSGPLDDALDRQGPTMEDVPPETLVLWENRIIAADHSHSLFVWSGSATLDSKYDVVREQLKQFLLERSHKRFPMPNLHMLGENDSMSRRFTALLGPSHGDPVEHQLVHFQALMELSTEQQTKLKSRFRFYDPDSDPSFRQWFWEVASAASASGQEGVSLCE